MLRWKHLCLSIVGSLVIVCGSGCSMFTSIHDYIAYNDASNDFVLGWRNEVWARQSWHENKACVGDREYLKDFGKGYRAGYADVASGGNGCPPVLPPRCYWAWHYQTPEGQAKVAAWFAGYPHGAATAERDNAGGWQEIQVSHQIETQYSPEFQDGTIFLPEEMIEQMRCDRPDPSMILPTPDQQNRSPLAPQADSAFLPAAASSAFPYPPTVGAGNSNDCVKRVPPPDYPQSGLQPDLAQWQPTFSR